MKDIQEMPDDRNMPIEKVGIKNLRYPITVLDRASGHQHTVATISMYVDLPHQYKGTHMSRFVETLHVFKTPLSMASYNTILQQLKSQLNAMSAHVEVAFPYFVEKKAPVSFAPGMMDYECRFVGKSNAEGEIDLLTEVRVPISSVCPCSKEISDAGAHNQRGEVTLQIKTRKFFWIEDMIKRVEAAASCDVYSVLKRVDEKYVTEMGYENPKFVEDVVRDIAKDMENDTNVVWFSVGAEHFESIHNHSAYAYISSDHL